MISPLLLLLSGGGIGTNTTASLIANASDSQSARPALEDLAYLIQQVQAGQTGTYTTPNSYMLAPSSPKLGWEQAAWVAAQAANQTGGANAYSTMAEQYLQNSLTASSYLNATIAQKQEGLLAALTLIERDPALISLSTGLRRRIDPTLIGQSTSAASENEESQLWNFIKETTWDTATLVEGAAGLVTGKVPYGVDPARYNRIRYGIYAVVGLGVSAYIVTQVRGITRALKSGDQ